MNNKFFADRNDFVKYDLLLELVEKGHFRQLTLIPMLTPKDNRKGGQLTEFPREAGRRELYEFLRTCLSADIRDIRELRKFFQNRPFQYTPYKDTEYFRHETRTEYFRGISDSALQDALVFLDPDNGLEVDSMSSKNSDRYVRFDELRELLHRIADTSVLMVFQYFPRQNRSEYVRRAALKLRNLARASFSMFISDNRILFVLLFKNVHSLHWVHDSIQAYAQKHGLAIAFFAKGAIAKT